MRERTITRVSQTPGPAGRGPIGEQETLHINDFTSPLSVPVFGTDSIESVRLTDIRGSYVV